MATITRKLTRVEASAHVRATVSDLQDQDLVVLPNGRKAVAEIVDGKLTFTRPRTGVTDPELTWDRKGKLLVVGYASPITETRAAFIERVTTPKASPKARKAPARKARTSKRQPSKTAARKALQSQIAALEAQLNELS